MSVRLAIVCTHPIQYNVPVFRELAGINGVDIRVFYGWRGATSESLDHGFGQNITWDIPLLDGYEFEFVENTSKAPGSHHFRGIDSPSLNDRVMAWDPSSILVYGWCYKSHLQLMRSLHGKIPILFRGDSTLLEERTGMRRALRRQILRWIYRKVDIALYAGTNNRAYFLKHGLRDDQLVFAPHAVDNKRFESFDEEEAGQLRKSLGIGPDDLFVLFAGKLEPIKAPNQLLEAFRNADSCKPPSICR